MSLSKAKVLETSRDVFLQSFLFNPVSLLIFDGEEFSVAFSFFLSGKSVLQIFIHLAQNCGFFVASRALKAFLIGRERGGKGWRMPRNFKEVGKNNKRIVEQAKKERKTRGKVACEKMRRQGDLSLAGRLRLLGPSKLSLVWRVETCVVRANVRWRGW